MGGTGPGGVEEEEDDTCQVGRGGIIQNKCSVEEMVEEGTGRENDEYA